MLKIAIVLCAVFLASAVSDSLGSIHLETAQRHVQQVINGTFSKVEEKSKLIQEIAQEVNEKLMNEKNAFNYEYRNEIMLIVSSASKNITDFNIKVGGANITVCRQLSTNTEHDAYSVIDRLNRCLDDQLVMRLEHIDSINKTFSHAFGNLTEIREVAQHCDDNVQNLESSYIALSCIQLAAINATTISDDIVELSTFWATELKFSLNTFQLSFANCKANNGYYNFVRGAMAVVHNNKICIQRIIELELASLDSIQRHLQQVIQEKSELIQKIAQEVTATLVNITTKFNKQFTDDILDLMISAGRHVNDTFDKVEDANIVAECDRLARHLVNVVNTVINRTQSCAIAQRDIRLKEIGKINKTFIEAFANLTAIRLWARNCDDNVRNMESSGDMSCTQLAALKSVSISENIVKVSSVWINGLKVSLNSFQLSLGNCRDINGYLKFYRETVDTFENSKPCVQRMTDEATRNVSR